MPTISSQPKEVIYYGEAKPLPKQVQLKAGPLNMVYENGAIRYVKLNGNEVLRMVYSAVRDQNWGTIAPEIKSETIINNGNSFTIDLEVAYKKEEIHFVSNYKITGSETGNLKFEMDGKCLSTFKKNRIGFCVLHPITECAGKPCFITDNGGNVTKTSFPQNISPHQPFKKIKNMHWGLPHGNSASLQFEGDIFEAEDHRNWTDASYKIYCTPLEWPFPVTVQEGETVHQKVELNILGAAVTQPTAAENEALIFEIYKDKLTPLPRIGVAESTEVHTLSPKDRELLKSVGFGHYRIDVKFDKAHWKNQLQHSCQESLLLGLPLEIALHFTEGNHSRELEAFVHQLSRTKATVFSFMLFQKNQKTTPDILIKEVLPVLRKQFPSARIGGGTDAYFTELNRETPSPADLDFLSYSINPQVHAFDNLSLVETLEAQEYTALSAQDLASKKDVHVSPVTFKPRFNPDATEELPEEESSALQVDSRQMSLFGAGWSLGSIKYLAEAVKSITYYETAGRKGLFMPEQGIPFSVGFPADRGDIFPLYYIFKDILGFSESNVIKSKSNQPLQFDGLALEKDGSLKIILANFQNKTLQIKIPSFSGTAKLKELDAEALKENGWKTNTHPMNMDKNGSTIKIPAFGIVSIEFANE